MSRRALTPALPIELIDYILRKPPSALIICQPRATFIDSLFKHFKSPEEPGILDEDTYYRWQQLNNVVVSKKLAVYFIPTVSHLRGLLASLALDSLSSVVVFGLVKLHEDTSQWSAQGCGNTLSTLVDTCRNITICEERNPDYEEFQGEGREVRKAKRIRNAWQQQVPLLSGNEKREGLGDAGYSGRTIEMMRVVGRWFQFFEGNWIVDDED